MVKLCYTGRIKAYSLNLRKRIIWFVAQGGSKAEATRRFGISKWTVYRYFEADREGSLTPKPCGWKRPKKFEDEALSKRVKQCPRDTLKEYGQFLGVSHVTIWNRLRRLNIT